VTCLRIWSPTLTSTTPRSAGHSGSYPTHRLQRCVYVCFCAFFVHVCACVRVCSRASCLMRLFWICITVCKTLRNGPTRPTVCVCVCVRVRACVYMCARPSLLNVSVFELLYVLLRLCSNLSVYCGIIFSYLQVCITAHPIHQPTQTHNQAHTFSHITSHVNFPSSRHAVSELLDAMCQSNVTF